MSPRFYRRLTRYAVFTVLQAIVATAVLLADVEYALLIIIAVSLPIVFAWGAYHADVALNPSLDELSRRRWRMLFFMVPWSMVWYWHTQARPRAVID